MTADTTLAPCPTEREQFETWARTEEPAIRLERSGDGYRHFLAREWWGAWHASRRAQAPAVEAKAARWDWLCRHWSTLNVKFNKDGITLKGLTLTVNANAQGTAGSPRLDSIADQGIAEEADQGITGAPNGKPT